MSDKKQTAKKMSIPMVIVGVLLCFAASYFGSEKDADITKTTAPKTTTAAVEDVSQSEFYYFKNEKSLKEHFKKHGADTYCKTKEEYLQKANDVINNPKALTKIETDEDDGDRIFYIEKTDEIVFLSTDNYIRTYFICSGKDYFDRQ